MALFKISRGNSTSLPSTMTDGWAYFCTDTGEFFIDYADSDGVLNRKQVNAEEAKRIVGLVGTEGQIVSFDLNGNLVATNKPTYDFSELTVNDPEAAKTTLSIENGMVLKNLTAAMPNSREWKSVAYGNGKFVAVPDSGSKAAYSEDGIAWTETTLPSSGYWFDVAYGNDKFVAMTESAATFIYSADGITWTKSTLPSSGEKTNIAYGDGKFVVALANSTTAMYSTDGITWTTTTLPVSKNWKYITYGNGKFIAVAHGSFTAAYSTDGVTWTETTISCSSSQFYSVVYGDNRFVALANSGGASYSEDAITWTSITIPSGQWVAIYGGDKFVAISVGYSNSKSMYSTDGITWTETTLPISDLKYGIAYGNGKFVVPYSGLNGSTVVIYSYDGITWHDGIQYISQNGEDVTATTLMVLEHTHDEYLTEQAQSDWSVNDSTAPDYVQNRTHYTTDPVDTLIVEEQTLSISSDGGYDQFLGEFHLTEGLTHIITFNGTEYECIAWANGTTICVGNGSIIGDSTHGNGEPFCIESYASGSLYLNTSTAGTYTVSIRCLIPDVIKLDPKYLVNSNIVNGSQESSLRTIGSAEESDEYTIGQYAFAEGKGTQASGRYSHAEGYNTIATGEEAHAEGWKSQATGDDTHAEGYETKATKHTAHAEGYQSQALNLYAHAEGKNTIASGLSGHAEGNYTVACASNSHAEGSYTLAYGDYSHAEGGGSRQYSFTISAEAGSTTITCSDSYAFRNYVKVGYAIQYGTVVAEITAKDEDASTFTVAKALSTDAISDTVYVYMSGAIRDYSHVEGQATIALSEAQHVQGKWNVLDTDSTYAHIVGNGTNFTGRSNAHTIDWDGNAWFAGTIKVGGTGQDDALAQELATLEYVKKLLPKVTSITLGTTWSGSASPYYQDVALAPATETSMVTLQPTPEQLATWQDEGLAFTTLSGDGTVRVYVAGSLPSEAITVQVMVQEVTVV